MRRRRKANPEYLAIRERIAEEAGWACQARTTRCNGRVEQIHHRKGRDGELLTNPEYLLPLCEPCHTYIHAHPAESYERGWMVRRNHG
jgi:hypothetical protein